MTAVVRRVTLAVFTVAVVFAISLGQPGPWSGLAMLAGAAVFSMWAREERRAPVEPSTPAPLGIRDFTVQRDAEGRYMVRWTQMEKSMNGAEDWFFSGRPRPGVLRERTWLSDGVSTCTYEWVPGPLDTNPVGNA